MEESGLPLGIPFIALLVIVAIVLQLTMKIFAEYERGVVLRFGRFQRVAGPGITFLLPLIDVVYERVDTRVVNTPIIAEEALTSDTTPIDVNAVIFWRVQDARKAALEVTNYATSLTGAAQTALREIIGRSSLNELLKNRAEIDRELKSSLLAKATAWGVELQAIEIRDIKIPTALQNAMSQQAQAEREREARIILGSAERDIAQSFVTAAENYATHPMALELRRMNILYEGLKTANTTMIVVPSSISEALAGLGSVMAQQLKAGAAANPPRDDAEPPAYPA
jgi:regulator of protease activity HflC (stomatin/prohibitin superfamily)